MSLRPILSAATVAAVAVLLSGCWMPLRFDSEIEFNRYGSYKMIFDGYLVETNIYEGLRDRTLSHKEERERAEMGVRDLKRDPEATKEASYLNKGRFHLHWVKEGDLTRDKMVAFLRRNQKFITLSYVKEKRTVSLKGMTLNDKQLKQLLDMGLTFEGQIRIITDARVTRHDAHQVKRGAKTTYMWNINPQVFAALMNEKKKRLLASGAEVKNVAVTFPNMDIRM